MKSALPKCLHPLAGRPMIAHLIANCAGLFDAVVVVVGPGMEAVARAVAPHAIVVQQDRRGTAHAALQAAGHFGAGDVAILYADNPLISAATIGRLLGQRRSAALTLLAMRPPDPGKYGRVIERGGIVERIVEAADATPDERAVTLCNAGVMCADAADMRRWLAGVQPNPGNAEYYLTDIVAAARAEAAGVLAVEADFSELRGINSRAELAAAEAALQSRLRDAAMAGGATLQAPETVFFSHDTRLGQDVTVGPNVVFAPGVSVGDNVEIRAFSHLEGAIVEAGAIIGPFARLRPGTRVGAGAHVGNFVELKATSLGAGAKANHLSYLGDADIGPASNIGAGTITCNYDGTHKHRTSIGGGVFVGSDAVLVAPLSIGDGAFIAAGSVITQPVEPDALAFGRARQKTYPGEAARLRNKENV